MKKVELVGGVSHGKIMTDVEDCIEIIKVPRPADRIYRVKEDMDVRYARASNYVQEYRVLGNYAYYHGETAAFALDQPMPLGS